MGSKSVGQDSFVTLETNATTTETAYTVNVQHIVWLSNDGAADIKFNFDKPIGEPGTFTLRTGERLGYTPKTVYTLYVDSVSGTNAFRFWGIG